MNKPYVYYSGSNEISQNKQICTQQNEKKLNKSFIKVKLMCHNIEPSSICAKWSLKFFNDMSLVKGRQSSTQC